MTPAQTGLLAQLTECLDAQALWWLSGYSAGLARAQEGAGVRSVPTPPVAATAAAPITIVYGSQTGNSQQLALRLLQELERAGLGPRLCRADAYALRELPDERYLVVVVSTHGDGDPPDDARDFVEFLLGRRAPRLPELKFAVLGLGDSSYPKFCEVARRIDARLAELGASRWLPRADADLDINRVAMPWLEQALELAKQTLTPAQPTATVTPLRPASSPATASPRLQPFVAELLGNQRITGRGSYRDVRHLELSLQGSGLSYEPGDALGVLARNAAESVDAVLHTLRLDADELLTLGTETLPLHRWLAEKLELTRLSRSFVARHAEHAGQEGLRSLLLPDQAPALAAMLSQWQPIDLLRQHPANWSATDLVAALRPLKSRLYSIASSQKEVGDEVHLTVAHVEFERDGEPRWGVASHHLSTREPGQKLPVFVERNERFRLPQDDQRDLIMIAAGTGVAPFRAFVQERMAVGARGRHWLVFGNPRARSDFLYQLEWQRALKRGRLQQLDLAFSRDGASKTYVQHALRKRGRDLHAWLRDGAHLYVCGGIAMGRDVHATLIDVLAEHADLERDAAEDFLRELSQQGRYARDLY